MLLTKDSPEFVAACNELVQKIKAGLIVSRRSLDAEKIFLAKKYRLPKIPKNPEILAAIDADDAVRAVLKMKPMRTASGIANIAVMWLPENPKESCPANCIYCAQGHNSPKSYTGTEPATMRAQRLAYDPHLQVENRLRQFKIMGHDTDKCELIIMGGTFMSRPVHERDMFVKRAFDAFNNAPSQSLAEAQLLNETSQNRVIGMTIETRADFCNPEEMLRLGTTRVEIGIQSTDDEILRMINRGHLSAKNKEAIRKCRSAGLKVCCHWMPGLTGLGKLDVKKEVNDFSKLFSDPDYMPDEIKIYPTLVIEGTDLYLKWMKGEYEPLQKEQLIDLIIEMKKHIPEYVRVKRIMRDIAEWKVSAGTGTTNIRQLSNAACRCIRCREIKSSETWGAELKVMKYEAGGSTEYFISFEKDDKIVGFCRLGIGQEARIRELHVYGMMAPLKGDANAQHKGFGRMLVEKAEEISRQNGRNRIYVTSGIGVMEYYRKLGYEKDGYYMAKNI